MFQKKLTLINTSASKECDICQYFKDIGFKYERYVCDGSYGISMMAHELKYIAILNLKGVDYRYVLWNMSKTDIINRLNNSKQTR